MKFEKSLFFWILVLGAITFLSTFFLSGVVIFFMINILLMAFCIGYLALKKNYLYFTAFVIVAVDFLDKAYFYFTGELSLDLILLIFSSLTFVTILLILIRGIYLHLKNRDSKDHLMFVFVNLLIFLSLFLASKAYIITYNSQVTDSIIKTDLYYLWIFLACLIPSIIVLLTKNDRMMTFRNAKK